MATGDAPVLEALIEINAASLGDSLAARRVKDPV
jgi:hypothetical protein